MPSWHRNLYQVALMIYFWIDHLRMQILEVHGLKREHYSTRAELIAAADMLIKHQRDLLIHIEAEHPNIIVGDPMLDQFWYVQNLGIVGWFDRGSIIPKCVVGRGVGHEGARMSASHSCET